MKFTTEQKIIHHLMLKSFDLKDIGLLNGKMGIVIFFFHYAKHFDNNIYGDFAGDLLDQLLEDIHKEVPFNFESGLSGIAWGIEYLIHNNLIEGDGNEICEELDKKIITIDTRRLADYSMTTGLGGIIYYVLARVNGAIKQHNPYPFDTVYISDLIATLKNSPYRENFESLNQIYQQLIQLGEDKQYSDYQFNIKSLIRSTLVSPKEIYKTPLGLNGLSGYLLTSII